VKSESQQFLIRDRQIARNAIEAIKGLFSDEQDLDALMVVEIREHKKDRSGAQNRLSFLWYRERAKQMGTTPEYEHRFCKLRYGCPILQGDDEDFAELFRKAIEPMDYEKRIAAMKYLPVTRLMKVSQMGEYLTYIEQESAQQGIALTHPVDIYDEAMGRMR
jgi:hypothetical protein